MSALLAAALAAAAAPTTPPDGAAAPEREWSHHVARKAWVSSYDPSRDRLVLFVGHGALTLRVGAATVYGGPISVGRLVDVSWEDDTRTATFVQVRSARPAAGLRP